MNDHAVSLHPSSSQVITSLSPSTSPSPTTIKSHPSQTQPQPNINQTIPQPRHPSKTDRHALNNHPPPNPNPLPNSRSLLPKTPHPPLDHPLNNNPHNPPRQNQSRTMGILTLHRRTIPLRYDRGVPSQISRSLAESFEGE
jgi:hypothetical protein